DDDGAQEPVDRRDPVEQPVAFGRADDVDLASGEVDVGPRVARAARRGQVGRVDFRGRVGGRQDVVYAVAARPVRRPRVAEPVRQAVVAVAERRRAVRREAVLLGELVRVVARAAHLLRDVDGRHRRGGVAVLDDAVLAVARGARRRVGDARGEGPAVGARHEGRLGRFVAGAARLGQVEPVDLRGRVAGFHRLVAAVAVAAYGGVRVARGGFAAVDALAVGRDEGR